MKYFQKYFYAFTGLTAFIIYLTTIAPSVIQIDTGELATVQATLGIAHPTGYPLFTMVGYLFSLLPLPFSKIFQLNLLAAIYCSTAVAIFTYSSKLVLDNLNSLHFTKALKAKSKRNKKENQVTTESISTQAKIQDSVKIFSSVFGGLFLAFSKTFWFQSTSVEVYSLHLLLISIVILFLFKAFLFARNDNSVDKFWLIFAVGLALSFSNHMTTILIIPAVAYLYFSQNKFNVRSFKQIILMLLIFFPILILLYSYLPIRASQDPILNWGNPIDMERILRHISGHQYQVWLFSSTEAASKQFKYFINNLFSEYSVTLIIIAAGFIFSFIKAKKFFISNTIVFVSTVLYSINYDINDIDSYFLLAYISLVFFAVFGILQLFLIVDKNKISAAVPFVGLLLILVVQTYSNHGSVDQSRNYVYEDYTKSLINSVPENSIIFSYQWDFFISASYYFQKIENFRDDVIVIDKELLRRSWYYKQLDTNYPGLLKGINLDVEQFLEALKPFEREENFNATLLENLFRRIMSGLISTNIDKHDYFIAPELVDGEMRRGEFQLPQGYTLVPHLFLFKVVSTSDYVEAPLPEYKIRLNEKGDQYQTALKGFVSSMLIRRGLYELQFNKTDRAKIYAKKIAADFPETPLPQQLKDLVLD